MRSKERASGLPAAMLARHAVWASHGLVATVRVIADEVKRRGVDPAPLLRAHGLDTAPLWSPFSRAPRGAVLCFVEDCIAVVGDPALHVTATANAEVGAFHMADYLALMAPTFGAGCGGVMERFHLVNSGCAFTVDEQPNEIVARFSSVYEPRPHAVEAECTFVAIDGRARIATNARHGLARVDFAHPDGGTGDRLRATLGCPVRFEQASNRVVIERAVWSFKPSFFSAAGRSIVQAAAAPFQSAVGDESFVHAVRTAVAEGVAVCGASVGVGVVARGLGMSDRSLQRRLAEKGTSFGEMLDQERREIALRRMSEPGARASEVGYAVGFSEASAFTRAFRRWTGMSPSEDAARHSARSGDPGEST